MASRHAMRDHEGECRDHRAEPQRDEQEGGAPSPHGSFGEVRRVAEVDGLDDQQTRSRDEWGEWIDAALAPKIARATSTIDRNSSR